MSILQSGEIDNKKIGILTPPIELASIPPLSDIINVLSEQSYPLYLITGNDGYTYFKNDRRLFLKGINYCCEKNSILRVIKFFCLQIRISIVFSKIVKKCDIWIFFLGGQELILPMIISKLFRKKVGLLFSGSSVHAQYYDKLVICIKILTTINCILSDKIILYSNNLIKEWQFDSYRHKILIAHQNFIDFDTFTATTPFLYRPSLIGYIGRLSPEKGVQHFVQALPTILTEQQDLRVIIGGEGKLKESIQTVLETEKITDRVDLTGWITHNDLPKYLNRLRLLVLPSYTEGLPNIMLEAMACGTPVLATPVGGIPDVIRDGETGFIIQNNSPECISENVIRALSSPELDTIAERGRRFVEEEYTFEKTNTRWREILDKI